MITKMSQIICIACSVFRPELTALQEQGKLDFQIRYLDSNLHMTPAALHARTVATIVSPSATVAGDTGML